MGTDSMEKFNLDSASVYSASVYSTSTDSTSMESASMYSASVYSTDMDSASMEKYSMDICSVDRFDLELEQSWNRPRDEESSERSILRPDSPDDAQPAMLPVSRRTQITILICAFLDVAMTSGLNQAYGVFLTYYLDPTNNEREAFLPSSQLSNKATIAFVGTLAAGLTWGGSIFVNPLMARTKDPRKITFAGGICLALGYILASFSRNIWQLLLTQGLLSGVGASLLYFPVLAVAPEYFDAHRGSAMGTIVSGAGIGGLCYAPAARALLASIGVRWTLRTLGIFNFALAIPVVLTTPSSRSRTKRPALVNISLAKKPAFMLQALAACAQAAGNFVPLTFLSEFSTVLGYSAAFGAALLAINNGVNTISRIFMGFIADKVGRQNTLVLSVLGSALTVIAFWLASALHDSTSLWIAFIVTYAIFAGGYNTLFPTTVIEVFGSHAYASVNGFIYFIRGVGALWGSPVGGMIVGNGVVPRAYVTLIWYDFGLLMLSSVCVIAVRGLDAIEKGRFKLKA